MDDLPPAFVLQVLLEDNFGELVDAVGFHDSASLSGKQADTVGDIQVGTTEKDNTPEVTEVTNAPVSGISPSPSRALDIVSTKFVHCKDKDLLITQTGNMPVSAKGSHFTRYLIKKTDSPKGQGKNDTCAAKSAAKKPQNF